MLGPIGIPKVSIADLRIDAAAESHHKMGTDEITDDEDDGELE
jgi:hypothetical protein